MKKSKIYVATVYTETSRRTDGDLACWTGLDKDKVVARALRAKLKYESNGYGPYRVLIGVLVEEASELQRYKVTRL